MLSNSTCAKHVRLFNIHDCNSSGRSSLSCLCLVLLWALLAPSAGRAATFPHPVGVVIEFNTYWNQDVMFSNIFRQFSAFANYGTDTTPFTDEGVPKINGSRAFIGIGGHCFPESVDNDPRTYYTLTYQGQGSITFQTEPESADDHLAPTVGFTAVDQPTCIDPAAHTYIQHWKYHFPSPSPHPNYSNCSTRVAPVVAMAIDQLCLFAHER